MLGKLINNNLIYPSNPLQEDGRWILNPLDEDLKKLGYKNVVHEDLPNKNGFYKTIDKYIETDIITVKYKYEIEKPAPELAPEEIERTIKFNKNTFLKDFIVTPYGCIRKKTAIGDFIAVLPNITMLVQTQGKCSANTLVLYPEPDYANNEQCTNEWLVANQFGNKEMTVQEYNKFVQVVALEYQKLFKGC